jgi:hypothetical protein
VTTGARTIASVKLLLLLDNDTDGIRWDAVGDHYQCAVAKLGAGCCRQYVELGTRNCVSSSRFTEADRWSSGGPAEERQGIPLSQLLAMALEATRVICAA